MGWSLLEEELAVLGPAATADAPHSFEEAANDDVMRGKSYNNPLENVEPSCLFSDPLVRISGNTRLSVYPAVWSALLQRRRLVSCRVAERWRSSYQVAAPEVKDRLEGKRRKRAMILVTKNTSIRL